jgi:hypothetical protein
MLVGIVKVIPKQSQCHLPETQPMADMQLCILASVLRRSRVRRTMLIVVNPIAWMPRASVLLCVLDVLGNGVRVELAETHWPGHAAAPAGEAVYEPGVWMIL